jgi:hypothetical protein
MIGLLFGKFLATSIGGKLPRWAWIALAGAVALAGALLWHHHAVVSHDNAVRAAEDAKWKPQLDQANANIAALRTSIAAQNAAVRKLADTSKAEQAEAAKAIQSAQERVSEAEAVSERLKAQSRPAAGKSNRTGTCEPDAAAKENWQ